MILNDVELLLQVFLLLSFLCEEYLRPFLFDDVHLGFEDLFVFIGHDLVFLRVASSFKIFFLLCLAFCKV